MDPWSLIVLNPVLNILIALSQLCEGQFGIAIIIITIVVRGAMYPLTVRQLRSSWLRVRGAGALSSSQTLQVYVYNVRAGGLDYLNARSLDGIVEIRYYSGPDATTKWGTGVGGGVIELITARR